MNPNDREKAKNIFLSLIDKRLSCGTIAAMAENQGYNLGVCGASIVSQYNVLIRRGTYLSFGARVSKKGECRRNLLKYLLSIEPTDQAVLVARTNKPITNEAFGDLIFSRMLEDLKEFNNQKRKDLIVIVNSWMQSVKCNLVEEALLRNGYTTDQVRGLLSEKINQ